MAATRVNQYTGIDKEALKRLEGKPICEAAKNGIFVVGEDRFIYQPSAFKRRRPVEEGIQEHKAIGKNKASEDAKAVWASLGIKSNYTQVMWKYDHDVTFDELDKHCANLQAIRDLKKQLNQ